MTHSINAIQINEREHALHSEKLEKSKHIPLRTFLEHYNYKEVFKNKFEGGGARIHFRHVRNRLPSP